MWLFPMWDSRSSTSSAPSLGVVGSRAQLPAVLRQVSGNLMVQLYGSDHVEGPAGSPGTRQQAPRRCHPVFVESIGL